VIGDIYNGLNEALIANRRQRWTLLGGASRYVRLDKSVLACVFMYKRGRYFVVCKRGRLLLAST
jgi:hypothetical protein